jgi:hypothetical protein
MPQWVRLSEWLGGAYLASCPDSSDCYTDNWSSAYRVYVYAWNAFLPYRSHVDGKTVETSGRLR